MFNYAIVSQGLLGDVPRQTEEMIRMFGSKRRQAAREEAIRLEARRQLAQRPDITTAVREVLASSSHKCLYAHGMCIYGSNEGCGIVAEENDRFEPRLTAMDVKRAYRDIQVALGRSAKMWIVVWGERAHPHIGHLLAPGWRSYSIPYEPFLKRFESSQDFDSWCNTPEGRSERSGIGDKYSIHVRLVKRKVLS